MKRGNWKTRKARKQDMRRLRSPFSRMSKQYRTIDIPAGDPMNAIRLLLQSMVGSKRGG